ncbi:MAG: GNAT family N-acetyltransferase [Deltaproteobacteria bacterium]|nr:GNAT family N-acetyltransferase [Deltaproteobacteria bacterium]
MWRRSRPDEHELIAELSLKLFEEDPSPKPPPAKADVLALLSWLVREPVRGLSVVLDVGAEIRGYGLLISFLSNELKGEVCVLDEIYVIRAERGRGRGTELIEAIARGDEPWGRPPVAVELEVSPDNRSARALYERLGFAPLRNAMMRRMRSEGELRAMSERPFDKLDRKVL